MNKYYADFNSDPLFLKGEANKKTVKAQIANNNALLQQQKKGGMSTAGNMPKLNNKNQYGIASTLASNQSKQGATLGNGNNGGYRYDPKTGQTIRQPSVLTQSNSQGIMKADSKALRQALFEESEDVLGRLFLDGLEGRETPKYLLQNIPQKEEKRDEMSDELGYAFLEGFNYNDEDALRELEREKNRGIYEKLDKNLIKREIEQMPQLYWLDGTEFFEKKEKIKEKKQMQLNEVLDNQYPTWAKKEETSDWIQDIKQHIADNRLENVFRKIDDNRNDILTVSFKYGIPYEVIGSIILKEQYTQSIPDELANVLSTYRKAYPFLYDEEREGKIGEITKTLFKEHSTGLGAVSPKTARAAWEWLLEDDGQAKKILPSDNVQLQYKLSSDEKFNIETIGVVLIYEAYNLGLIRSMEDIKNLTYEDWQKVCKKYNGTGDKAQRYGEYVREYFPDMKEYLEQG